MTRIELSSEILKGCINSYTNSITKRIDNYNRFNRIGEYTHIKCCMTKRKDNMYIINMQYNPKIILGIIDTENSIVQKIILNRDYYPSIDENKIPQIEFKLNKDFRYSLLKNKDGDVI